MKYLLLGAGLFWSGLVYSLTGDPFVAAIAETVMAVVLPCAVAAWWHGETLARAFQLRARGLAAAVGVSREPGTRRITHDAGRTRHFLADAVQHDAVHRQRQ